MSQANDSSAVYEALFHIERALAGIDPDASVHSEIWSEVSDRIALAGDVVDIDPTLASATLDDVIDRWPGDFTWLWQLRVVELANIALGRIGAL